MPVVSLCPPSGVCVCVCVCVCVLTCGPLSVCVCVCLSLTDCDLVCHADCYGDHVAAKVDCLRLPSQGVMLRTDGTKAA
jgi:hypothetical protein